MARRGPSPQYRYEHYDPRGRTMTSTQGWILAAAVILAAAAFAALVGLLPT